MAGNDQVPPTARPDTRLTCDEFLLFPDDGKRHELIDGIHYVTPSPNLRHQDLAGRLHLAIGSYLAAHPGTGRLFERTGVREYWLVDPWLDLFRVDRREESKRSFRRIAELTAEDHDVLETPLLPGFSLALAVFFAPSL